METDNERYRRRTYGEDIRSPTILSSRALANERH